MAVVSFKRGNKAFIDSLPIVDGQLIFNTETGEMYEDVGSKRIPISSSSIPDTTEMIRVKKLWKNASPTSHFVAQTLSLDFSDAKFIIVVNKVREDAEVFNTTISVKGRENRALIVWGDSSASRSNTIANNSIEFSTGSYLYTGSSHSSYAKGTGYCIPIEIYKVVL